MAALNLAILACFLCSSLSLATLAQNCNPDDLSALKEFASQLINGSVRISWSDATECCKWEGVVCESGLNSVASRVIGLRLSGKGLKGKVPGSLSKLDGLKLLDLSHNSLGGELPKSLSNLKHLRVLDFSRNWLDGSVSEAIAVLKSIQSLNLSGNGFSGNLTNFGVFPNLVALNISDNLFTGQITPEICTASKGIEVLDLSFNHLTGGLEGLRQCSSTLRQLHLGSNSLSGDVPDSLYSFPYLEQLSIPSNYLAGELSTKISHLYNLRALIICSNRFSGYLPNVFGNLSELEHLDARSNSFSGPLPSTLALCSKLRVLDLQNNSLSGPIDLDFAGLSNLCDLNLASNLFSGPLPETLASCRELKVMSLAKNNLTGSIPESYANNLSSLTFVSLSNNSLVNLSGSLSILKGFKSMMTLILTKNFHGEEIPKNMSGFESLAIFALGNCGLKGRIPDWLSNCRKLQVLDLSWNQLEGNIPSWIGRMENLFYLDLSNNSLTGGMPKSMTELKSLISAKSYKSYLNNSTDDIPLFVKRNQSANGLQYRQASSFPPSILLSNNRINGAIWPEIGKLKQLHVLDLSRNNISGTITSSISNMGNLETLDLSYNDLHGSIPSSFNQLTFLSKFSVAHNHLDGAIPSGGQFLSFPSSSFEGNPGLCGKLYSPCPNSTVDGLQQSNAFHTSGSKFGRNGILEITIGVGVGIAILLAFLLLRISRRNVGLPIEDVEEEINRVSDAIVPPKIVLFKNADCKDLTISDLLKSTNNFSQSNIVGCGGFGLVYKADLPNGKKAAIKRLSGDCGQMEREFQAEVEALSRAQHKSLVSLQGYCCYGTDRLLIYSYMENGSLDYWLHEKVDGSLFLTWDMRLRIAQGAAQGLAYLHKEPNIIHRDIKTSNILLDEKFEAHLADFGLSRLLHPYDTHVTTDLVGTLGYIPPEYSQMSTATFRGDVYSFGVVLVELLTGRRPVEVCKGKNCRDLVGWVYQKKCEKRESEIFDSCVWEKGNEKQVMGMLGIACRCIEQDPRRRPSIDQVVSSLDSLHQLGKDSK